jgi:serine/threonine protein kinase
MSENQHEYKIVDNFLIFKELGTDALGVNYRAGEINRETRKTEQHYLVTEVHPFLSSNPTIWKRVNILLEGVKKSNIPKLFSPDKILQLEDKYYLVYPLIKFKTFEQVLDDSTRMDIPINFDLAFSIVFAAADLIDIGSSIVVSGEKSFHGFLTPDNIIIDYDGKILLKNYGIFPYLSREEEVAAEMEKKYGAWIAPEFLSREKLVSQTDIYHLGYITYRILTGKYFSFTPGENFDSKFANISFTQHIPSADKEYLTDILTFFKKSLNPVPSQRFANIKEFKDFISNKFHIEELSSITFNLAYFMNSLYLESLEEENEALERELEYTLPEEKKKEEAAETPKSDDQLVEEILTGLDEQKKSRTKFYIPLILLLVVVLTISGYIIITQQKQVKKQEEQQIRTAQDMRRSMEKFKQDLETEYQRRLKSIEDKATNTEDEKKSQEDEIKKLREWQKEETRKVLEKQRMEEERLKKLQDAEEERKIKEAEREKQKKVEEQERLQQEIVKKQEEQRKELVEEQKVMEGQLVSLVEITERPQRIKGKNPVFSPLLKKKYRGTQLNLRSIILIDENGAVTNVRMLGETPDDLKSVITRAFKRWKYSPAKKDGVKVKVWLPVEIKISF